MPFAPSDVVVALQWAGSNHTVTPFDSILPSQLTERISFPKRGCEDKKGK